MQSYDDDNDAVLRPWKRWVTRHICLEIRPTPSGTPTLECDPPPKTFTYIGDAVQVGKESSELVAHPILDLDFPLQLGALFLGVRARHAQEALETLPHKDERGMREVEVGPGRSACG